MINSLINRGGMNYISCTIMILLFTPFHSCNKEKGNNSVEGMDEDGRTTIVVTVLGIKDDNIVLNANRMRSVIGSAHDDIGEIISHEEGFDSRISVGDMESIATHKIFAKNEITGKSEFLKATKMEDDIVYHLLIYKAADNSIAYNRKMKSGEQIKLVVDAGVIYNWIAYSYNTNVPADLPIPTNAGTSGFMPADVKVPIGNNTDFLFDSGNITPIALVNTPLGIFFEHKTARIAVELNTMGMFADIKEAEIEVSQLKTGVFDLISGARTGILSDVPAVTTSKFERAADSNYDDRQVAYFYTADETTLANLTVVLKSLTIGLDDYAVDNGSPTRVFGDLSTAFNSANFKPIIGRSKLFKIDLIESPVTTRGTANFLGASCCEVITKWARANLYYVEGHNPYRFQHINHQTTEPNTYFSVGSVLPSIFAASEAIADPCELVYPENTWRTANSSDYNVLVGGIASTILYSYPGLNPNRVANQYIEYPVTSPAVPQYPHNNLRFNYNGSAIAVALVEGLVQLSLLNSTGIASIWTNSKSLDLLSILDLGHNYYYGTASTQGVTFELLSINLLGSVNVINSGFRNIRCVRQ